MLHELLVQDRSDILALCATKILRVNGGRETSHQMDSGLEIFYDELIQVLSEDEVTSPGASDCTVKNIHRDSAVSRGKESLRLGYSVSQVVHGYGAICQAITKYASDHSPEPIEAREFNRLNYCLDEAIAEAVTEFNTGGTASANQAEVQRLGFLAHELRNALATASTAHQMIKMGLVGLQGSTNQILETAHKRMRDIIDRSLSEVRMGGEPTLEIEESRLVDLVSEVEATALPEVRMQSLQLRLAVDPDLFVRVDRHLILSAISNLVQNAIKFTRPGGTIWVRGRGKGDEVFIEIADECGGLPSGRIDSLFEPFVQANADKSGVGLGLSISRRAVALNGGKLTAHDLPGHGCIFTITLPRVAQPASASS